MSILQVLVEHNTTQQNAYYIYIPSVSLIGTVIDDDLVNIVSQAYQYPRKPNSKEVYKFCR